MLDNNRWWGTKFYMEITEDEVFEMSNKVGVEENEGKLP